jgi:hypothetical protein
LAAWRERRSQAVTSLILGVAGIAGTLLFLNDIDLGIGLGGMERVAFYPLTLWCGVQGIALARSRRRYRPEGSPLGV